MPTYTNSQLRTLAQECADTICTCQLSEKGIEAYLTDIFKHQFSGEMSEEGQKRITNQLHQPAA